MREALSILALAVILGVGPLGAAEQSVPLPVVSYSADRIIESSHGTIEGKLYYMPPGRERHEMKVRGMSSAIITRHDLGVVWVLLGQGMYIEKELGDEGTVAGLGEDVEIVSFSQEGTDVIDGHDTRRFSIVTRSEGAESRGKLWLEEHNIPLRMEIQVTSEGQNMDATVRMTDLEVGPQPHDLFAVPKGYTKLDMGAGGAGGFPGLPGVGDSAGGSWTEALAEAAKQGAKEGAKQETREQTKRGLRKAIRSIFD